MEGERDKVGLDVPVVNAGVLLAILTILFLALPERRQLQGIGPQNLWRLLVVWGLEALRGDRSVWRMLAAWFVVAVVIGFALPRLSALALAFIPPVIAAVPFTRDMFGDFGPQDIIARSGFLIPIVDGILLSPIFFIGVFGIGIGIRLREMPERLQERRLARKASLG